MTSGHAESTDPLLVSVPSRGLGFVDEWLAARARIVEIERAEHPDITDRHGRVWVWRSGNGPEALYAHDETLAFPRLFIDDKVGLPSPKLADNPNYSKLCGICRSQWPLAGVA